MPRRSKPCSIASARRPASGSPPGLRKETAMQTSDTRLLAMLTTALGPVGPWLHDATVVELMVNSDGRVWVEHQGEVPRPTGILLDPATIERVIRLMATHGQVECHAETPRLSAVLPGDGARFQGF